MEFGWSEWGGGVNEDVCELTCESDVWEEQGIRGVDTSGWCVCWVEFTCNVCGVEGNVMGGIKYEFMYSFEYLIDLIVVALIIPPPFDHPIVIAMDEEVGVILALWDEDSDEALKADGLSPGDVSSTTVH